MPSLPARELKTRFAFHFNHRRLLRQHKDVTEISTNINIVYQGRRYENLWLYVHTDYTSCYNYLSLNLNYVVGNTLKDDFVLDLIFERGPKKYYSSPYHVYPVLNDVIDRVWAKECGHDLEQLRLRLAYA